jgi:large subunit ribosomal protein L15
MFKLNNLKSPFGSNSAPKRKGRGIGSGNGKTAGKGHKGQHARSGASVGPAFEGGQMPLERRSPKVGFRSPLKMYKVTVNVTGLGAYDGQTLSLHDIVPKSYGKHPRLQVSVVGNKAPKTFPKSLETHRISPSAKALLESKGVAITLKEYKDGSRPRVKKAKAAKAKA